MKDTQLYRWVNAGERMPVLLDTTQMVYRDIMGNMGIFMAHPKRHLEYNENSFYEWLEPLPSETKEVKESAEEILKEVRCNIHKYDLPKEKRDKLWKVANDIALLNKKESLLNLFEKFWNKEAGFVVFERFLYACMNEYAAQFNQSVPVSEENELHAEIEKYLDGIVIGKTPLRNLETNPEDFNGGEKYTSVLAQDILNIVKESSFLPKKPL